MKTLWRWMWVVSLLIGSGVPDLSAQSPKAAMMERLRSLMTALNAPPADFEAYAEKHFAPAYLASSTPAKRLELVEGLQRRFGKISAGGLSRESPTRVIISITGEKGQRGELILDHERSEPHRIIGLSVEAASSKEAAAAPPPTSRPAR